MAGPIFCSEEALQVRASLPRAVLLLLNKDSKLPFTKEDLEDLEMLAPLIGRSQELVQRIEKLHSMRSVLDNLNDVTMKISSGIDSNVLQFGVLKKNFNQFLMQFQNSKELMEANANTLPR